MDKCKKNKQSILFVTYHYPPDASVGAKRVTRLSKFLQRKGWDVGVLTVKEKYFSFHDISVQTDNIRIFRTQMIKSIRYTMASINRFIARINRLIHLRSRAMSEDMEYASNLQDHYAELQPGSGVSWLRRYFYSLIWCPDDKQGWIPFAFIKCLKLSRKFNIVYSSCPVFSVNLILLLVKFFHRDLNWVAEFRDPWTKRNKPHIVSSSLTDWLEKKWEGMVIEKCSKVVVVNEAMRKDFINRYPSHADKICVFYNGYDEREFIGLTCPVRRTELEKATFLYAGSFYHGRDPTMLLSPIAELIHEGILERERIEVRLLGDSHYGGKPISQIVKELSIADIVSILNYLPQRACIEEINRADVLVLFNVSQPLQVPAKLYEYFAFRKRILAISTGGITDELIKITNTGISVDPKDIEGIKGAIKNLVYNLDQAANEDQIERFRTDNIFEALSSDLEGLEIAR